MAREAAVPRGAEPPAGRARRRMVQSLTVAGAGPNQPAESRWIPVPDVPVRPILSFGSFFGGRPSPQPCVLDHGHRLDLSAGRIAIARALEMMELAPGDKVLLPAYHCASMIDPLAWVDAEPLFYRLRADLSADLADIEAKLDPKVRALVITHYFGFPQDLQTFRAFCDRHGLFLMEDCAHSLFGSDRGTPLGTAGDYAITSLTKFLPVREGGTLVTADPRVQKVKLDPQGPLLGLMESFSTLQDSTDHKRLSLFLPLVRAVEAARSLLRTRRPKPGRGINPAQSRSGAQGDIDWSWIDVKASPVTALIERLASRARLVDRRIDNYRRLAAAFEGVAGCRVVYPTLAEGVVPYMFPLWIDDLDTVFPLLEDKAVPMQRFGQFLWTGVDSSVCAHSAALSKHLVQFPCHQELTEAELDRIVATVTETLTA